jgi:hypothetical protein
VTISADVVPHGRVPKKFSGLTNAAPFWKLFLKY